MAHAHSSVAPVARVPWRLTEDGLTVSIKLTPNARRAGIEGLVSEADGTCYLAVRVTAPPADGRANAALIKIIAKQCGIASGRVSLAAGAKNRRKRLLIEGDAKALAKKLSPSAA